MLPEKISYLIATGFGSGYFPRIPGTAGSLLALFIYVLLPFNNVVWLAICASFFFIGVYTSGVVEQQQGKDPGLVVIDEFVGQWIALLFLPRIVPVFVAGFIIFRFLDIIKPFPANDAQNIARGWGIMIDDIIAGIYTNAALQVALIFWKGW